MPFITVNGQLQEVSQAEYDIYTIGQKMNPAAGGNVTQLNNTQTILTPNTSQTIPNQVLPISNQSMSGGSTISGTYIGNQLFVPGQQLTTQQLAAIQASQALGNQVDPLVLAQFNAQGGQTALARSLTEVSSGPTTSSNTVPIIPESQLNVVTDLGPAEAAYLANPTPENQFIASIEPATSAEASYLANPTEQNQDFVENGVPEELTPEEAAYLANPNDATQNNVEAADAEPLTPEEIAYLNNPNADTQDLVENNNPQPLTDAEAAYLRNPTAENQDFVENGVPEELTEDEAAQYFGKGSGSTGVAVGNAGGDNSAALAQQARLQQTISQQRKNVNNQDWRVTLRLAPQANYLYKDPNAATGILQPLAVTDGIIFPYTPNIDTQYKANYSQYDLTHSNYRGYFYQNSYVDAINLKCTFTAQSTFEANYLLATIHFLRSVTKMFYGQDAQRGSPPPLVYLSGLGEYQFNEHPCLVSAFNYSLPSDVDYIRAGSANINNTNLSLKRSKDTSLAGGLLGNLVSGAVSRLANAGLTKGSLIAPPPPPTLGTNRPTYVPTKMEISVTLLPVQSRAQVSQQFSLKQFASGDLLKGGFW